MNFAELTQLLSDYLADNARATKTRPFIFGVSGGQGAGKTTLCDALITKLSAQGLNCLALALDDFYLPKAARAQLAETVHPNCQTRGVPGTHDIKLLAQKLSQLSHAEAGDETALPVFSKSHDEQLPKDQWRSQRGRPDIIFLEGWCVGGRADFLTAQTPTAWEQKTDPESVWKNWTLAQAAAYEAVWDKCDALMLLRQQSFDAVIDSRWLQEQSNAAQSGIWQFDCRDAVAEFCAHYESWTRAIWQHLPARAAFTLIRDADFTYQLKAD